MNELGAEGSDKIVASALLFINQTDVAKAFFKGSRVTSKARDNLCLEDYVDQFPKSEVARRYAISSFAKSIQELATNANTFNFGIFTNKELSVSHEDLAKLEEEIINLNNYLQNDIIVRLAQVITQIRPSIQLSNEKKAKALSLRRYGEGLLITWGEKLFESILIQERIMKWTLSSKAQSKRHIKDHRRILTELEELFCNGSVISKVVEYEQETLENCVQRLQESLISNSNNIYDIARTDIPNDWIELADDTCTFLTSFQEHNLGLPLLFKLLTPQKIKKLSGDCFSLYSKVGVSNEDIGSYKKFTLDPFLMYDNNSVDKENDIEATIFDTDAAYAIVDTPIMSLESFPAAAMAEPAERGLLEGAASKLKDAFISFISPNRNTNRDKPRADSELNMMVNMQKKKLDEAVGSDPLENAISNKEIADVYNNIRKKKREVKSTEENSNNESIPSSKNPKISVEDVKRISTSKTYSRHLKTDVDPNPKHYELMREMSQIGSSTSATSPKPKTTASIYKISPVGTRNMSSPGKRRAWTDQEEAKFLELIALHPPSGNHWAKILAAGNEEGFFLDRTSVNLKDKWRNIIQKKERETSKQ